MSDKPKSQEGIIDLRDAFSNNSEPKAEQSADGSFASNTSEGKHARPSVNDPKPPKKRAKVTLKKVLVGIVVGILALVMAVVVAFVAYMRLAYMSFYDEATPVFETPGINSGFIPQDIDYVEDYDIWLFSGYESDGNPSPIWKRTQGGNVSRVEVENPDGSRYADHGSGITSVGDKVYLTTENGYLVLSADEVASAEDEGVVVAEAKVDVGFDPAFLNAQDGTLYTGVFYYAGPYDTPEKMHLTAPDGTENSAIMYAYQRDDATASGFAEIPDAVYSIPDKVQGVSLARGGKLVLSTSWGFAPSNLYVYDLDAITESGTYDVEGVEVPLLFCDATSLVETVEAPPMMEGIDQFDGRIFLSNEAASNKYIFGKLYGAGTVYFLDM